MPKRGSATIQMKLRLTRAQHQQLERDAKRRGQTLNAEMLRRLAQSRETETLVQMITGGSSENAWLLDMIARCLYVLRGWEGATDADRHRSLAAAISLLITGIRKASITNEDDVGEVRDAEGRGRLLAYSIFNRTIGKEPV